ncbi:MAG: DUF2007 domain-containing protein [Rhizobacter sp.]|jgi:hypothetical protein
MKTLFEAASAVEAHMVRDLLRQEGIAAFIHGEHLQGAMGELPAAGLVRLVVDEADYPRGRAVIDAWEAVQPKDIAPRAPTTRPRLLLGFLAGIALGAAVTWTLFRAAVSAEGIDADRDGVMETRWFYSASGAPLRSELDRNHDGKVDHITHFDGHGVPDVAESDDNFDGVFEVRWFYRNGFVETAEMDSDGDGYFDLRTRSAHGVAVSTEYLDPATGLPLRVEHYRNGKIVRAEVDTDRDGVLDQEQEYGGLGDVRGTRRLPAP